MMWSVRAVGFPRRRSALLGPALLLACSVFAQGVLCAPQPEADPTSTSAIRGTVSSADDELPIAGAEVTVLHVPSGNQRIATTKDDGSFAFTGLAIGGPYTATAVALGFDTGKEENIFLTANKTRDLQFGLKLSE